MKKQNVWACSNPTCLVDVSREICPHLEKLLPQMGEKRVQRVDIANASMDFIRLQHPQFSLEEFTQLMRSYGFYEEWDIDLLTAKYFYGQSVRQIANDFAYCSFKTVARRLKTLHALLKERGFKPRTRKS